MKLTMLVGEPGVGKSALIRLLSGGEHTPGRAMGIEFCGRFINTPGEFLENRRFYRALITTAAACDILLLVQDATRPCCLFPPGFTTAFGRPALGIISRTESPQANAARATRFLRFAGVHEVLAVNLTTGDGVQELLSHLQ